MTTMFTKTFVENVKHQTPLIGHESFLLCLQLKLDATENLNQDALNTSFRAKRAYKCCMNMMVTRTFLKHVKHKKLAYQR